MKSKGSLYHPAHGKIVPEMGRKSEVPAVRPPALAAGKPKRILARPMRKKREGISSNEALQDKQLS